MHPVPGYGPATFDHDVLGAGRPVVREQGELPTMLDDMSESDGAVLAFRARGLLTAEDYQNVLVPRVEAALKAADRIRVLILMDETFRGWNARAAWSNTRLDLRHRHDFDKVAIVGAPTWEEWCVKAANLLLTGELRTFERERLDDAWAWLRG